MICFQARVIASQKTSTRSVGRAMPRAVSIEAVSLSASRIASSGTPSLDERRLHQLRHLVGRAAARVVVAVADVGVEVAGDLGGDVADVLVAAVAGAR